MTTKLNAETNDTAATAAEQGATVAPEKTTPKKPTRPKKGAPKNARTEKAAKPNTSAAKQKKPGQGRSVPARREGKGANILEMIGRGKGATLAEIMGACGWQAHSVRGFISTAGKKHGVQIESVKNEAGDRLYRTIK